MNLRDEKRITTLETQLADALEQIAVLVDAMDAQHDAMRELKYRLTYTMERIVVRKRMAPGTIIAADGQAPTREETIAKFWMEDREQYIKDVEATIEQVKQAVAHAEARRQAVVEEIGSRRRTATTGTALVGKNDPAA